MPERDKRIDAEIACAPAFARPILERVRAQVHKACPEAEETLKWGMPHFTYRGSILLGMGSFKAHVAMGFWLGHLIVDRTSEAGMGQFGRLTSVKDLPSDRLMTRYVRKAMELIEAGVKNPTRSPEARARHKPPPKVPAFLQAAFRGDSRAAAGFAGLPPGKRREYIEWLAEARTEATREKRLSQALEWMAEGKGRNWKYERKSPSA